jgi:hypothetical protein
MNIVFAPLARETLSRIGAQPIHFVDPLVKSKLELPTQASSPRSFGHFQRSGEPPDLPALLPVADTHALAQTQPLMDDPSHSIIATRSG